VVARPGRKNRIYANDHRHDELCCHSSKWLIGINSIFSVIDCTHFNRSMINL